MLKSIRKHSKHPVAKIFLGLVLIAFAGLGLGSFLGKTLLERQGAKLVFRRNSDLGGALVILSWSPERFIS